MTTKPSSAPWVDEPFRLIELPSTRLDISLDHVYGATEMAHAHNVILRGLNAILLQAPHVSDSTSPLHNPQDVKDLLFYVRAWTKMVHHHHWVEESFMFPEMEKVLGVPGYMDDPKHQHELFHDGLERLGAYAETVKVEEYRWEGEGGMRGIIDGFSAELADHLYKEIDVFLGMGELNVKGLRGTWEEAEKLAKQTGNIGMLYDVFPAVLGLGDKTYAGGNDFPPLPWVMPYLIKYWFARGNGAWRFHPCDWWGQPRPLAFGPPISS